MRRSHSRRRYYSMRNARKSSGKAMSDGTKIAIALGGAVVLGGIGYLIYKQQSASASMGTGGAGGGTLTSGAQSTVLGAGGSSTPLPAAEGTPSVDSSGATTQNDFEAGAGENAPLVPT